MATDFTNKVITITGGASGIGLATANLLHARGATLSICDASQEALDALDFPQENFLAYKCDVRDFSQVQSWIQETLSKFGQINGAANFAGVLGAHPWEDTVESTSLEDWDRIIGIDLTGIFNTLKSLLPHLAPSSSIVNATSLVAHRAVPGAAAYTASKHGVIGLTRSCAKDYTHKGIRVNAVAPGWVGTNMYGALSAGREEVVEAAVKGEGLGRVAEPEEVARVLRVNP
ncbi:hypothetical protein PRZ48_003831 [Zasmidium cellare]|uniref:Ketoreductase domain-containing protein n=1 Tax=Zasmidium cellare TaxID=395010 RepID=A0ABR0EXR1_ZASCE|nr:hypothetical protein PRZ48_003831 [Zasmidium cellare]